MKYIRTKDGVYYINSDFITKNKIPIVSISSPRTKNVEWPVRQINIKWVDIIKEANTIEELCDEFIVDCKSNIKHKPFVYTLPKDIKDFYNSLKITKRNTTIYGAIWARTGLIYVAKMNSKGKLKLL